LSAGLSLTCSAEIIWLSAKGDAVVRERCVCRHAIQAAVKDREFEVLEALKISWPDGALGAGRTRMREAMLHIERLCRLPQLELLRRRALDGGGR
jgi:hypothetical protein